MHRLKSIATDITLISTIQLINESYYGVGKMFEVTAIEIGMVVTDRRRWD